MTDTHHCPGCEQSANEIERLRSELAALRDSVALAYGHLWHVNNDPDAPVCRYLPKDAAYAARLALRETLSNERRGEGINRVRAMLAAAKEK